MNQIPSVEQRALGALWGLAIGDAMGMPTSFLTPDEIREQFGEIVDFQPPLPGHRFHDGLGAGHITDDTEQSLGLARSFVRCGRVVPEDIVRELLDWAERVRGTYVSPLGPSTARALQQIVSGSPIATAGREGDTNGAAMRIAPLGILHGIRGSTLEAVIADVTLACLPTHGTDVAIASAAALAWAIASCFRGHLTVQEVLDSAREAAEHAQALGCHVPAPSIARRIEWIAQMWAHEPLPKLMVTDVYELIGTGVAAADSVPAAFGVFAAARGDPRAAILLASNMGGDCDTIAAMAGALAGAFQGIAAIPPQWVEEIARVNELDLDSVAQGLAQAAGTWQPA